VCRACAAIYAEAMRAWGASLSIKPIRSGERAEYHAARRASRDADEALDELRAWRAENRSA
jgi:hypothetical protein